jgi:hypothetical protein
MQDDLHGSKFHSSICSMIDKSLAGDASVQDEATLRSHLESCSECRDYLALNQRAIASLKGFSFGKGPEARDVIAAIVARTEQLDATGDHRLQLWIGCLTAAVLTIAGSFIASRVLRLIALLFPLHTPLNAERIHFGLIAFWVVPSISICLLFLLLPTLSAGWLHKKGFSI